MDFNRQIGLFVKKYIFLVLLIVGQGLGYAESGAATTTPSTTKPTSKDSATTTPASSAETLSSKEDSKKSDSEDKDKSKSTSSKSKDSGTTQSASSSDAPVVPVPGQFITIKKVTYGDVERFKDKKGREFVFKDILQYVVGTSPIYVLPNKDYKKFNDLFGCDPLKGKRKTLVVEYLLSDGTLKKASALERELLVLSGYNIAYTFAWESGDDEIVGKAIDKYIEVLPKIEKYGEDQNKDKRDVPEKICDFLCEFSLGDKKKERKYKPDLIKKIKQAKSALLPLKFFIIGFSVKTSNLDYAIESEADLAEFVALFTLNYICEQIGTIYKAGASVTIYPYETYLTTVNDLVKSRINLLPKSKDDRFKTKERHELFPKSNIDAYQKRLNLLVDKYFKKHIQVVSVADSEPINKSYKDFLITNKRLSSVYLSQGKAREKVQEYWEQETNLKDKKLISDIVNEYELGRKSIKDALVKSFPKFDSYIYLSTQSPKDYDISKEFGVRLNYYCDDNSDIRRFSIGFDPEYKFIFDSSKNLKNDDFIIVQSKIGGEIIWYAKKAESFQEDIQAAQGEKLSFTEEELKE